jgi:hypothetical protein
MIMPGVQMPHARHRARRCVLQRMTWPRSPSIVATRAIDVRGGLDQEFTGTPSTSTVHAPHSPSPHPSLVPVSAQSSRRTSRRRLSG